MAHEPGGGGDVNFSTTGALADRLYTQMRAIAGRRVHDLSPGQTWQATELVHETFLKLKQHGRETPKEQAWASQSQFLSAAVRAMRDLLVDQARRASRQKRGGDWRRITLSAVEPEPGPEVDVLILEEALANLQRVDPRMSELVSLRFYSSMTLEEAADALGISVPTAKRDWRFARGWLLNELSKGDTASREG